MFILGTHFFLKREGTESLTNLNLGTSGTQALNNVSTKRSHTGIWNPEAVTHHQIRHIRFGGAWGKVLGAARIGILG